MPANLTTKLGQLVDVLTPDTTNTRIGVANASPTRTLDVTGTGAISTSLAIGGATIGTNALAVTGTSALNGLVTATKASAGDSFSWTNGGATPKTGFLYSDSAVVGIFNVAGAGAGRNGIQISSTAVTLDINAGTNTATFNASGFGIGMTPSNVLDITQTQNATSIISLLNANTSTAAGSSLRLLNSANTAFIQVQGTGYTTSGLIQQDGMYIGWGGAGGITLTTRAAQPIYFGINSTEKARIDTNGCLLVNQTSSAGSGQKLQVTGGITFGSFGTGTVTSDASGNLSSVSDPSQKVILGGYKDGLAEIIATATPEFMGLHKWRPESGMETEGTYASFFARDDFPITGAVHKNGERPNSFSDRPVLMAVINAIAELTTRLATLENK